MALSPAIFLDKDGTLRRAVPYDVAPAGIPLRLGYGRENPYPLLTDHVVDPEPHKLLGHEVRRQFDLVASVGGTTDDVRLAYRIAARDRARRRVVRCRGKEGRNGAVFTARV